MHVPKWPVSVEYVFDICGHEDLEASHPGHMSVSRNVPPHAWVKPAWVLLGECDGRGEKEGS